MTLDARRIAVQGVGFGALAMALQGFVPIEVTDIPITVIGGGGAYRPRPQFFVPRAQLEDEELMLIITAALHVLDD